MTKISHFEKNQFLQNISSVELTYVVDSENKEMKTGGGDMLLLGKIIFQNDMIELSFDKMRDDVQLTSQDLRDLAEKLIQWADMSDYSNTAI